MKLNKLIPKNINFMETKEKLEIWRKILRSSICFHAYYYGGEGSLDIDGRCSGDATRSRSHRTHFRSGFSASHATTSIGNR